MPGEDPSTPWSRGRRRIWLHARTWDKMTSTLRRGALPAPFSSAEVRATVTVAVDGEEVDADRDDDDCHHDRDQDIYPAGHQQLLYTISFIASAHPSAKS